MPRPVRSYQDLIVWQKSMDLVDLIDDMVEGFSPYRRWSIGMQMYRAALSIASNIAEGHDDEYPRLHLRRLADARGSTREVETQIFVVRRRNRAPESQTNLALGLTDEIGRMLRSLSNHVRESALRKARKARQRRKPNA